MTGPAQCIAQSRNTTKYKLELACERYRIETLSILAAVIIASPTNWRETDILVHGNRGISVPNFKMSALYSFVSRTFQEVVEQSAPDPMAMLTWVDGDQ